MVVLLLAFMPDFLKINAGILVIAECGVGTHKYRMLINVIAENITLERCKEILFLHALSGSDHTSSFLYVGIVKFCNSWLVNQDVSDTFIRLGDCPRLPLREEVINVIERFIISLYYDDCNCFSIDLAQYEISKYQQNMDIGSLPPTRDVLIQHINKSAYVSGHIWGRTNLPNKTDDSSSNWIWSISSEKVLCT